MKNLTRVKMSWWQKEIEDRAEECRSYSVMIQEMLEKYINVIPNVEEIDRLLKMAESSVRQARKFIRMEIESREANRKRQEQRTKGI